jgi:hypothetical protein
MQCALKCKQCSCAVVRSVNQSVFEQLGHASLRVLTRGGPSGLRAADRRRGLRVKRSTRVTRSCSFVCFSPKRLCQLYNTIINMQKPCFKVMKKDLKSNPI